VSNDELREQYKKVAGKDYERTPIDPMKPLPIGLVLVLILLVVSPMIVTLILFGVFK
jgi:hypothetical protein